MEKAVLKISPPIQEMGYEIDGRGMGGYREISGYGEGRVPDKFKMWSDDSAHSLGYQKITRTSS